MTPDARLFALAALDDALARLNNTTKKCPCARCAGQRIDEAKLAIQEAIEQLTGRAAP